MELLLGKTLKELREWAIEQNLEKYRADQIYQWMFKKWEEPRKDDEPIEGTPKVVKGKR
jgi:adenine C2-methylase RlmN of 23S rRNA A2503 and tRNA A37